MSASNSEKLKSKDLQFEWYFMTSVKKKNLKTNGRGYEEAIRKVGNWMADKYIQKHFTINKENAN